jgi:hypothetical protein
MRGFRQTGTHCRRILLTGNLKDAGNFVFYQVYLIFSVLRIHDILGWIRIRIRILGSMPLTNGSGFGTGSGSCYIRH